MTEKGGFSFLEPPVSAKLNTTQPQTNETLSLKCSNLYLLWNLLMGSLRLSHLAKNDMENYSCCTGNCNFFLNYKTLIKYIPFIGIFSSYNCVVY